MIQTVEDLIAVDEGKELMPYKDSRGIWTVGIGHNLEANGLPSGVCSDAIDGLDYPACLEFLQKRGGLTDEECTDLFNHDLYVADRGLASIAPTAELLGTSSPRYAALMDMVFNMGETVFATFTTFLSLIAKKDFSGAASDLRVTKVYAELPHRYERLATMIETGNWP
jgi:lysozyme